jgi:hypothetical protein
MERELWPRLYHLVMEVGQTLRLTDVTYQPHIIVLVFLWAALHARPVSWACDKRNWATTTLRPATLPDPSTLSRRLPTPMTNLGGLCLELLSGKGLESAFPEGIGLKHETVLCHHGAVFPKTPMETRTVPWLHRLRLPARGHLPNGHNGEPSVLSRSRVRCVSFSPLKSGNKSNKPPASTVAGTGFAGHCNPSS